MAKNNFPSFNEYQSVLQSPSICFNLPDLKTSSAETDLWGLPRVWSGGFALTYKLNPRSTTGYPQAVRCFHRFILDRGQRYWAISVFLSSNLADFFIPIRYLTNGVLAHGSWFPITVMKWVEGDTLEAYIVKNINERTLLQNLSNELLRVVTEMERLGVAHGDLSHRNILIRNGKIVLVDYDGMFVPALQGRKSTEIGNLHFQLPGRTQVHFNENIDRFSAIVIYLALQALSLNPLLLERYETGGEGLLFQRADFLNPYQSAVLQELETYPRLNSLIDRFRRICTSEPDLVPRLVDFIGGKPLEMPRSEKVIPSTPKQHIINAVFRTRLLTHVGKVITVVGKVSEIFRGLSKDSTPHVFLNLGFWRLKCFTVVVWNDALQLCETSGKNLDDYQDRWISVTGIVTAFERRPQILVNSPTDIQLLTGEEDAKRVLGISYNPPAFAALMPALAKVAQPPGLDVSPSSGNGITQHLAIQTSAQIVKGSLDQTLAVLAQIEKLYTVLQTPKTIPEKVTDQGTHS